jgi:hypothetical protein
MIGNRDLIQIEIEGIKSACKEAATRIEDPAA